MSRRIVILSPIVGSNVRTGEHDQTRDAHQLRFTVHGQGELTVSLLEGEQLSPNARPGWFWRASATSRKLADFEAGDWLNTAKRLVEAFEIQTGGAS